MAKRGTMCEGALLIALMLAVGNAPAVAADDPVKPDTVQQVQATSRTSATAADPDSTPARAIPDADKAKAGTASSTPNDDRARAPAATGPDAATPATNASAEPAKPAAGAADAASTRTTTGSLPTAAAATAKPGTVGGTSAPSVSVTDTAATPTTSPPAQKQAADEPKAQTPAVTPASTAGKDEPATIAQPETTVLEPTPGASGPDPLTPPQADAAPVVAPGAPATASGDAAPAPKAVAVADPLLDVVRARLANKPKPANVGSATDLAALKAFYAKPEAKLLWVKGNAITEQSKKLLDAMRRADTFGLESAAFSNVLSLASAEAQIEAADTEIEMALGALKYARYARGGRVDPPSLSANIDMRPRLYEPGSLLTALAIAPSVDVYLENLHPQHAGFRALKEALAKVRDEKDEAGRASGKDERSGTERRLIVNMERWRWLPDNLGNFYVWDNVPEQLTRVYHDSEKVLEERIVVGKAKTPTPMFSAPMRFVIFQPSWGVPDGIKTNEIGPMLRRAQARQSGGWLFGNNDAATRALSRHELKVYSGGREVNPDSVDWARVDIRQFQFTQPPSPKNVLGVVKFRFPNKFDVYMHDTADRNLFSRSVRTFSHGCMRVQNPLKLAETILAYDKGWSRGHVQSLAARSGTTSVTLDKTVPVHIVYFTASVDQSGKLHSHADIYGMDSRVASALAGRSVTLTSAKPVAAETTESGRPQRSRRASPERASSSPAQSSRPFNPFSGLRDSGG